MISSMDTHYTLLLSADPCRFHTAIWSKRERERQKQADEMTMYFLPHTLISLMQWKYRLLTESIPRLTWLYNVMCPVSSSQVQTLSHTCKIIILWSVFRLEKKETEGESWKWSWHPGLIGYVYLPGILYRFGECLKAERQGVTVIDRARLSRAVVFKLF